MQFGDSRSRRRGQAHTASRPRQAAHGKLCGTGRDRHSTATGEDASIPLFGVESRSVGGGTKGVMITVIGLDHFVLRVRDLDASLRFYRDIFGLPILFLDEHRAGQQSFVSARLGNQLLDLVPDPTYDPHDSAERQGLVHFCIEIEAGHWAGIIPHLKQQGVTVLEERPVPRSGARGLGRSIYITDPDGYVVELKEYTG
jgi:catechol 2,3-dioxygenase-like lactoylglutathione lyase family enzyme